MRVLYIDEHLSSPSTGGGVLTEWEKAALRELDPELDIHSVQSHSPYFHRVWRILNLICLNNSYADLYYYFKLFRILWERREQYDLVYVNYSRSYLAIAIAKLFGCNIAIRFHNAESDYYSDHLRAFLFFNKIGRPKSLVRLVRFKYFSLQSRLVDLWLGSINVTRLFLTRADLERSVNSHTSRSLVVPPPAPLSSTKMDQAKVRQNSLVFVGNGYFEPNEASLFAFLDAYKEELIQARFSVTVIGKGYDYIRSNQAILEGLDIEFFGFIDDLDSVLVQMSAMICPIVFGSGIKIKAVESLSLGLPVIVNSFSFNGLETFSDVYRYTNREELRRALEMVSGFDRDRDVLETLGERKSMFTDFLHTVASLCRYDK